jgi:Leucine-rich repeat (LRR) protein
MSMIGPQNGIFRRCFVGFCILHTVASQLVESDILRVFFLSCNGFHWFESENWMSNEASICEWSGITCSDRTESVEKLELRQHNISCTIPAEMFYLPKLRVLDLSGNEGVIANFRILEEPRVGPIEKIFLADGSTTSLRGINRSFSNSLTALSVAGNLLAGPFPREVLQLTGLHTLDLSYNFISGALPAGIGGLTSMQSFALQHNLLSGPIPSEFGDQSELYTLMLQFNQLTGTLPTELGNLSRLSILSLNDQGFDADGGLNGPLFDFANLGNLFTINLANNKLSGTVPTTLLSSIDSAFSFLMMVDLSGNSFSGAFPSTLTRFESLRLYLTKNHIDEIPQELCQQNGWFFGEVGEFGCDAILCPPGTFTLFGRQVSAGYPCEPCGQAGNRFFGGTNCDVSLTVRTGLNDFVASMKNVSSDSVFFSDSDGQPSDEVINTTDWKSLSQGFQVAVEDQSAQTVVATSTPGLRMANLKLPQDITVEGEDWGVQPLSFESIHSGTPLLPVLQGLVLTVAFNFLW